MHATEVRRRATYAELMEALTAALTAHGCTDVRTAPVASMELHDDLRTRVRMDVVTCCHARPGERIDAFALLSMPSRGGYVAAACPWQASMEVWRTLQQHLHARGIGTGYNLSVQRICRGDGLSSWHQWVRGVRESDNGDD